MLALEAGATSHIPASDILTSVALISIAGVAFPNIPLSKRFKIVAIEARLL